MIEKEEEGGTLGTVFYCDLDMPSIISQCFSTQLVLKHNIEFQDVPFKLPWYM